MKKSLIVILLGLLIFGSCNTRQVDEAEIRYEQFTLNNGLDVILHQDHSDPIVAVAIQFHVGSGRESPGRTGFAHLFEHFMFTRSENVDFGQFDQLIQNAGGCRTLEQGTMPQPILRWSRKMHSKKSSGSNPTGWVFYLTPSIKKR